MNHPFIDEDAATLAALLDCIIPPSKEFGVPGAGDDAILEDTLISIAPGQDLIVMALVTLNALAGKAGGDDFASLDVSQREAVAQDFQSAEPMAAGFLTAMTAQCYYRDDRVMRSLAMEARPPFPGGYEVEHGDWSLLDPVRERQQFWRKAEAGD